MKKKDSKTLVYKVWRRVYPKAEGSRGFIDSQEIYFFDKDKAEDAKKAMEQDALTRFTFCHTLFTYSHHCEPKEVIA